MVVEGAGSLGALGNKTFGPHIGAHPGGDGLPSQVWLIPLAQWAAKALVIDGNRSQRGETKDVNVAEDVFVTHRSHPLSAWAAWGQVSAVTDQLCNRFLSVPQFLHL